MQRLAALALALVGFTDDESPRNHLHPDLPRPARCDHLLGHLRVIVLALAAIACGPDPVTGPHDSGRRSLAEVVCNDDGVVCEGRWSDSTAWSWVFPVEEVESLTPADPPWSCDPDADVDLCAVDQLDHVGCFWIDGPWAVTVAPACAVPIDAPMWLDVSSTMLALTH